MVRVDNTVCILKVADYWFAKPINIAKSASYF